MRAVKEPLDGKDLVLSIDSKLQYIAYKYLSEAVEKHKAKAGSAIVLDTHTGEVLAMVNLPSFNPNDRRYLTGAQLRNRAMTDTFEPGSIMKPFPVALALEKGDRQTDVHDCHRQRQVDDRHGDDRGYAFQRNDFGCSGDRKIIQYRYGENRPADAALWKCGKCLPPSGSGSSPVSAFRERSQVVSGLINHGALSNRPP